MSLVASSFQAIFWKEEIWSKKILSGKKNETILELKWISSRRIFTKNAIPGSRFIHQFLANLRNLKTLPIFKQSFNLITQSQEQSPSPHFFFFCPKKSLSIIFRKNWFIYFLLFLFSPISSTMFLIKEWKTMKENQNISGKIYQWDTHLGHSLGVQHRRIYPCISSWNCLFYLSQPSMCCYIE